MTVEPTLDPAGIERLLEITGGDVAFVEELIDTYIEDAAIQIDALRTAAAVGDLAGLVRRPIPSSRAAMVSEPSP